MRRIRGVTFLGVPALLVLSGLTACSKKADIAVAPEVVRGVSLVETRNEQVPDVVAAVGSVHSLESAALASQVMGTVLKVAVNEGDSVRAGQTLISIDAASLRADLDRAQASVAAARRQAAAAESETALAAGTMKRYEALKEKKSVSPQEFEEVETRFRVASAHLEMVRSQVNEARAQESAANTVLGHTRLLAPFPGVVTERRVDPGSLATPGAPLLVVERVGRMRLEVSVDESLLSSVKMGASVPVIIDALNGTAVEGKVAGIVPAAEEASHSFLIKIDLPPSSGLRTGMYGRAQFTRGLKSILTIPLSAVVHRGSLENVYAVDRNRIAGLRYITLGAVHGTRVEVLSGLTGGETLIDVPGDREWAGKRIEVRP